MKSKIKMKLYPYEAPVDGTYCICKYFDKEVYFIEKFENDKWSHHNESKYILWIEYSDIEIVHDFETKDNEENTKESEIQELTLEIKKLKEMIQEISNRNFYNPYQQPCLPYAPSPYNPITCKCNINTDTKTIIT